MDESELVNEMDDHPEALREEWLHDLEYEYGAIRRRGDTVTLVRDPFATS